MRRQFRNIRNFPVINRILRSAIIGLKKTSTFIAELAQKHIPVSGKVNITINDFELSFIGRADDHFLNRMYYNGVAEENEVKLFCKIIGECRCFYDVGANIGLYSLLAIKVDPSMCVVSFEPDPYINERLKLNLEQNNAHKIKVHDFVVGEDSREVDFYVPEVKVVTTTSSVVNEHSDSFYADFRTVPIRRSQFSLDDFMKTYHLDPPDFIKLDVELNELNALEGSKDIIANKRPFIMAEVFNSNVKRSLNPKLIGKLDLDYHSRIEEFFNSVGYFIYVIGINGIMRIHDLNSNPDNTNYLFSPQVAKRQFYTWNEIEAFVQDISN